MSLSKCKLYEITTEYDIALENFLLDPEKSKELEEVKDNFENKAINVAKYLLNLEAEHEAIKNRVHEMVERMKNIAKYAENLKNYLAYNIEKTGLIDPIKCADFQIKLVKNPPSVILDNADLIPDIYKSEEVIVTIDKIAIKKDILEGFPVEGARIESKKRLVIK